MTRLIRLYFIPFSLLMVFAWACKVAKEYQRPSVELPEQFKGVSFADTSSIADLSWKQFFTDPALQALIEKGIEKNNDLQLALRRTEIAQQRLSQARALSQPALNLLFNGQFNRPSDNSLSGLSAKNFLGKSYLENYTAVATLSWEADIWGKIREQKGAALATYLRTYEGAKAVQTLLVSEIAQGYYNLQMLDRQLHIAERSLKLSDSFVVATRLLVDAGLANTLALHQAEAQQLATAQLIPQLKEAEELQEHALQLLIGGLPGRVARSNKGEAVLLPQRFATGLPAAILSRRPDVRAGELQLMIANAQVGIARANMYPALNLTAGAGLESFKRSNWLNIPGSLFGLAAGSIAQPLLNRRALRTDYTVAMLEREQDVTRFRQSVLQAVTEVSDALVRMKYLKEQEEMAVKRVDALQLAISNAQLLFKSDMATYLEVITAQSGALQAELSLASVQRAQKGSLVELYRALGGGWK